MDLTSYNEALAQALVIVFCGLLLYFGVDLRGMVAGSFCGYAVAQLISFAQVQRMMPIPLIARTRISRHKTRQLLGTGGWMMGSSVFSMMFLPFVAPDALPLRRSRSSGSERYVPDNGSMRVSSIFDAAFRPMMPEVSSLQVKGKVNLHDRVRSIDRKAFMVIFVFALPAFIVLMIVINPLLHLWLHRSFNPLLPNTFRIALIGAFASLLGVSAYYMLIGLGRARDVAYCTAIQFMVNAVVLLAIALWFKHVTVGEAAAAFGMATASATLYLRFRLRYLLRPRDALPDSVVLMRSGADS